jgi:CRP/FNR family cyclic AMP-dependent transcriptional regulator
LSTGDEISIHRVAWKGFSANFACTGFSEVCRAVYALYGAYQLAREQPQAKLISLVDVLEPLSAEELEELAARCPDIHLEKGQEFYKSQEHEGGLFLIKEGRVLIYKLSSIGEEFTLVVLSAGTALTARRLQDLHARALEPSVLAFMRREDLKYFLQRKPEMGLRLMDLQAEQLRLMDARMSDVIHKEVPARLASLILQLLSEEGIVVGRDYVIPSPYNQEQLGTMIGAKRVAVTRAFKRLRTAGAVEVEQRRIHVRDLKTLQGLAGQER